MTQLKSPVARLRKYALLALLTAPSLANAQVGPGVGNLDCGDAEYFKPFGFIENSGGPNGTNVSLMIRGYFMTVFAPDSGRPPGEIGVYDVSNPKMPSRVHHIRGGDTSVFREAHSLPVALIDGKHYVAFQTTQGIQFWDFTNPRAASRVGSIALPGVTGGDYDNAAWQTVWQGRYLYVAGANRGIYVVDAGDPTAPRLLHTVPTSQTGGFRVGPIFALGDYLVISNMDQGGAYAVLDISQPAAPALLSRIGNLPRIYAIVVGGEDRIYAAGRDGNFLTHSFTNPTTIAPIKDARIGQDQLYVAAQDHFVFLGRQNNVVKVDVTDEQNPSVVGEGTLGRANPDHGQVTPMGNLVFIGNDHGTGSAFFCHQRGRDTTPPTVQSTYPKEGSTGVGSEARVGLLFSDYIDTDTIEENIVIRPVGGEPLDGIFTYAFNTVSFGPSAPLAADTTFEVVVAEGGVKDVMGNAVAEEVLFRFSTGDDIVVPPPPPPEPPLTGGTGGTGGDGSGGLATTGGATSTGGAPGTGGVASGGLPDVGSGGASTEPPLGSGNGSSNSSESSGCSIGFAGAGSSFAGFAAFAAGLLAFRRSKRRA